MMIDTNSIRLEGFEVGHQAKRAGCYIPNPFMPSDPAYEHYRDGYDLGVRAALIDMREEEFIFEKVSSGVDLH